jgi:hypothetical protein
VLSGETHLRLFFADMGPCPAKMSLDRKDSNGDYAPENCRWATAAEQSRNRRDNIKIVYQGRHRLLKEVAEELGVSYTTLQSRYYRGYSDEDITGKPVGRTKTNAGGEVYGNRNLSRVVRKNQVRKRSGD